MTLDIPDDALMGLGLVSCRRVIYADRTLTLDYATAKIHNPTPIEAYSSKSLSQQHLRLATTL